MPTLQRLLRSFFEKNSDVFHHTTRPLNTLLPLGLTPYLFRQTLGRIERLPGHLVEGRAAHSAASEEEVMGPYRTHRLDSLLAPGTRYPTAGGPGAWPHSAYSASQV